MYAVAEVAGMQRQLAEGRKIKVPLLEGEAGQKVTIDKVFAIVDGANSRFGAPTLEGASVSATIVEHGRDRKVTCFKKKRRKGFKKKLGHRQGFTLISVDSISA